MTPHRTRIDSSRSAQRLLSRSGTVTLAATFGVLLTASAATGSADPSADRDRGHHGDSIFRNADGDPAAVAHRGSSAHAPENTLAAFDLAMDQGADFIELDVQQSSDGELFVFHDPHNMTRTSNVADVFPGRAGNQPGTFTLNEIRQLDAGAWNNDAFAGEEIPTLDETLDALEPPVGVLIELKNPSDHPGIEQNLSNAISDSDSPYVEWAQENGKLLVASIDHDSAEVYSQQNPQAIVGALAAPADTPDVELAEIAEWADFIGTGDETFSEQNVDRIHGYGLEALTNSSTAADMAVMIDRGADGAITDYPDRMLEQVAGTGPDRYIEAESLYDTVETNGDVDVRDNCCMRGGKWSGGAELRVRGWDPGVHMSVEFEVEESGVYDVSIVVGNGKNFGIAQMSLDGEDLGSPYDAYRPSVVRETHDLGVMHLDAGTHTLRFDVADQHPESGAFYASFDVLELTRVS